MDNKLNTYLSPSFAVSAGRTMSRLPRCKTPDTKNLEKCFEKVDN